MLPHSDHGDPECCGLIFPVEVGDRANLTCNECGAIIRSVPQADARKVLDAMEVDGPLASELCSHCGAANLFPGFDRMRAFTCRECGRPSPPAEAYPPGWPTGEGVIQVSFDPEDAPSVLTGMSGACAAGDHPVCPGHGDHEGEQIFCACECHRVAGTALAKNP
jgi:hypothetical protein